MRGIFKEISAVLFWKKGGTSMVLNLKNCANELSHLGALDTQSAIAVLIWKKMSNFTK